eukprot:CAMPEP_0114155668 /NCGR_PEP_ID=MMETSP0043_2-20121206/25608_1 /TAXON_ID=464988 /ORGANISM="Hemiselmis andersenii, Strain CCMP644" /LENGTH=37 /DNA_ID= /DNA_START= /DNA_END= /DNA_ORIENTATION=
MSLAFASAFASSLSLSAAAAVDLSPSTAACFSASCLP